MIDLFLDSTNKDAIKLKEIIFSHAKKLKKTLEISNTQEEKFSAIYAFYRKYYSLTLCKTCLKAGINKSPTRDNILDYPWKELNQDRIFCLKIWEKINH